MISIPRCSRFHVRLVRSHICRRLFHGKDVIVFEALCLAKRLRPQCHAASPRAVGFGFAAGLLTTGITHGILFAHLPVRPAARALRSRRPSCLQTQHTRSRIFLIFISQWHVLISYFSRFPTNPRTECGVLMCAYGARMVSTAPFPSPRRVGPPRASTHI